MSDQKKYVMAMTIKNFDPYGMDEITDYYSELLDSVEALIADLIEWYIGGELIDEDDEAFQELIKTLRAIDAISF